MTGVTGFPQRVDPVKLAQSISNMAQVMHEYPYRGTAFGRNLSPAQYTTAQINRAWLQLAVLQLIKCLDQPRSGVGEQNFQLLMVPGYAEFIGPDAVCWYTAHYLANPIPCGAEQVIGENIRTIVHMLRLPIQCFGWEIPNDAEDILQQAFPNHLQILADLRGYSRVLFMY